MSLSPPSSPPPTPGSLLLTVLRQWFWCGSNFMLIRVVFHVVLYSIASYLLYAVVDQQPGLGQRELVFLLLFTCSCVVSVSGRFLFLLVLGIGWAILLWHSLGLPLIIKLCDNFCFGEVSLPLGTWDWLGYFIVALPGPPVNHKVMWQLPRPPYLFFLGLCGDRSFRVLIFRDL